MSEQQDPNGPRRSVTPPAFLATVAFASLAIATIVIVKLLSQGAVAGDGPLAPPTIPKNQFQVVPLSVV